MYKVWREIKTKSCVCQYDLYNELPSFMQEADLLVINPPWNTLNLRNFYKRVGFSVDTNIKNFLIQLLCQILKINPKVFYLQMGRQNVDFLVKKLETEFSNIQIWDTVYLRRNPCFLIRVGGHQKKIDFTGVDEQDVPKAVMAIEQFDCVGDLCIGAGSTGIAAYEAGKRFVGIDINQSSLDCLKKEIGIRGGEWMQMK